MNDLHELIPLAVGMSLSPLPIVAIVAIVLAPRGRTSAPVFTASFTLVSLVPIAVGAIASANVSAATSGSRVVSLVVSILAAAGFAVFAALSWRSRPRGGESAVAPRWLAAIDAVTPARAAGLGVVMAAVNSKNVPLGLKGGALIGEAHLPLWGSAALCLVLALAASSLLIVPALVELGGSPRVRSALQGLKGQLIAHNAAMMTVVFALLAANEVAQIVHRLTP